MTGQVISPLHEAARAWAQAGFAVFPCSAGTKLPTAGSKGLDDATTDLAQIDRWWSTDPSFNVGVAPARTGMFVLDVDPPLGAETLARLTAENGALPDTLTIKTPRGGLHHWFTGDIPSSVQKLGAKLDTRGRGGYVLVPPSIVNGVEYSYEGDSDAVEPGPDWIGRALADASASHSAAEGVQLDLGTNVERARLLLRQYVTAGDVAVEGQGGDTRTYQVCCEVINLGLSPQKAFDVIWEEWAPHCHPFDPQWFDGFLKTKIVNASEYAQNEPGAWAVAPDQDVFSHVASLAPPASRSRFYPRDEGEQDVRPEPTWLIPNLLADESTAMMFGPSENFKSFLALDLSLMLAAGLPGWSAAARDPIPVVYIAAEGARSIERKRRPAWRVAREISEPLPFYTIDTMPLIARPQEVIELCDAIKARGIAPRLVVLDTFARAMAGKNENDAKDAGEFIEAIEAIKRAFHCTVLVLHHTGKEEMRGARGSSALFAGFDTVMEVKSDREKRIVSVKVTKQKDADHPATPWTFKGDVVAGSLVFSEIDTGTYQTLAGQDNPFSPSKVGAALRDLGAVTTARGVATLVLATHMCPPLQDDTPENQQRAVAGFAKRLGLYAKKSLAGYVEGNGRDLRWFLPSLEEAPAAEPIGHDPADVV